MQRLLLAPIATLAVALALSASATAQAPDEPDGLPSASSARRAWRLSDVLREAMRSSPGVRAAELRRMVAESHVQHAAMPVVRNPIVGVRALFGVPDDAAATYSLFVGVPFDLSSRQALRSAEVDLLVDEADGEVELERAEARARGLVAAARVAAGQDALSIAEARLSLAVQLRETMQQRIDAGAATALDLALVEQEEASAAASVAARRRELTAARDTLRAVLDLDPSAPVELVDFPAPASPSGLTLAGAVEQARARRREPHVLRLSARRLRVAEDRLFAESISPLVLSAEYEVQTNSQRLSSAGVGASMELPLFWTAQGDRAVTRAEAESADTRSEMTERVAMREAAAAWRALEAALAELSVVEQSAIPSSERALTLSEELLQSGAAEVFRILLARRLLFDQRERRVELALTAWIARAELERAVGSIER